MIDIRKLKELVRLMVANELTELDLRDSEEQVTLRRGGSPAPTAVVAAVPGTANSLAPAAAPAAGGTPTPDDDAGLVRIESPMVGTFYAAANPDSAPFVGVGSTVDEETVVCVVEAMKIFNEIKAGCSGTIHKVLGKNGEPVEFGQLLFLVRPD